MALLYGDFIPLRVEKQIYAYIRSFFGKNVLVVFNKGKETVSLKLDLPEMKREENFSSLFGNRFPDNMCWCSIGLCLEVPFCSASLCINNNIDLVKVDRISNLGIVVFVYILENG